MHDDARGTDLRVRPMTVEDIAAAEVVFHGSLVDLQERLHLPVTPTTPARTTATQARIALLQQTDPGGSFVIVDQGGEVVGIAQAAQREDLWTLCHFFVLPQAQNQGAGRSMLEAALAHGHDPRGDAVRGGSGGGFGRGAIVSTPDPRAMRRYLAAGFDLHPAVMGHGRPERRSLPATPDVRHGDAGARDLDLVDRVDRAVRGAARRVDIEGLIRGGALLLVVDRRGYAVLRGGRVSALVATDEGAATQLLQAGVAELATANDTVEVTRMVASQQWAMRATVALGLELHPHGPLLLRGWRPPTAPFLPDASLV